MSSTISNISQSEKIKLQYKELVAECEKKFKTKNAHILDLDKTKVSRVYNKQFDLLTLSEIASLIGVEVDIIFKQRR